MAVASKGDVDGAASEYNTMIYTLKDGSPSDLERRIKEAKFMAYFIGGMNVAVYWIAQLFWPQLSPYASMVEGIAFLALGYCIGERQIWAAWTAMVLLALDTILILLTFPQNLLVVGLFLVKLLLIIPLFHGLVAFQKIKGITTSDKFVAGIVVVAAVAYGGFAIRLTSRPPHADVSPVIGQILQGASTTVTSDTAPLGLNNLGVSLLASSYADAKAKFTIQPPKGWTIDGTGANGSNVTFMDPTPHVVAIETVSGGIANPGHRYTPQTFAAGAIQVLTKEQDVSPDFKIISQKSTVLDGHPAYLIDFTYSYIQKPTGKTYPMHATQIATVGSDGSGYNIFFVSQERIWPQYQNLLLTSAWTFRFPK